MMAAWDLHWVPQDLKNLPVPMSLAFASGVSLALILIVATIVSTSAAVRATRAEKAAAAEQAAAPKPDFKQAMDRLKQIKAGEKILKKQKGGESDEAVSPMF